MNKLFLTTALAGVTSLFCTSVLASPAVTIGGKIDFQAGLSDQDSQFETGEDSRDLKFRNDTEVHVNIKGMADNGIEYGAVIELEADVSDADSDEGVNADKTYIYLKGDFGSTELGANTAPADNMKVDASSIARATGGIDGDYFYYFNYSDVGNGNFIKTPDLPVAEAKGDREHSNKIAYYSPRFSGVQLGISYSPDDGDVGSAEGFTGEDNGNQEDVVSLGLSYDQQFNDFKVKASATGEFGTAETVAGSDVNEDLAAWALGFATYYRQFAFAGSYGDWGDSDQTLGANADDSNFWTLGAAYENGPAGLSVTYMDSEYDNNEFTNLSVGADYKLAEGLVPYIEVNFVEFESGDTPSESNDGSVFLIGTMLSF